jgi:hypothetical protein
MTRSPLPLVLAAVVWMPIAAASQAHPDFSGRWTVEADAPPAAATPGTTAPPARGDMGSGWGSPLTITQDASQLTVEYTIYTRYDLQPPLKFVYALDGSESKSTVMMGRGAEMRSSRTSWDGMALNITTIYTMPDPVTGKPFTTEVRQRLTLASPTSLVVEVTRSGALGGRQTTAKAVYRKG